MSDRYGDLIRDLDQASADLAVATHSDAARLGTRLTKEIMRAADTAEARHRELQACRRPGIRKVIADRITMDLRPLGEAVDRAHAVLKHAASLSGEVA